MYETIACMVSSVVIVITIYRLCEVTIQHTVGLRIDICSGRISQQVLRLIAVDDTSQAIIVEQWSVELPSLGVPAQPISPLGLNGPIMSLEVNSRHTRISLCSRIVLLGLCQISLRVEVSHTHRRVAEVSRSTVYAVGNSTR